MVVSGSYFLGNSTVGWIYIPVLTSWRWNLESFSFFTDVSLTELVLLKLPGDLLSVMLSG